MMLGQIAIHRFVAGKGEADAGGDEAMRFLGGIFADDGEGYLAGLDVLQSFAARDQFAIGREDGGDAHDVAGCDARVAKRKLEAGEPFAMFSDALGEKYLLSDKRHGAGVRCLRENVTSKILCCGKVARRFWSVNAFQRFAGKSAVKLRRMLRGCHKAPQDQLERFSGKVRRLNL